MKKNLKKFLDDFLEKSMQNVLKEILWVCSKGIHATFLEALRARLSWGFLEEISEEHKEFVEDFF